MKTGYILLIGILASLLLIGGCVRERIVYINVTPEDEVAEPEVPEEIEEELEEEIEEEVEEEEEIEEELEEEIEEEYMNIITVTEGELVTLNVQAVDPDGDELTYMFSDPVSADGTWQTSQGDAGEYVVEVTVSDGIHETSAKVKIVVEANQPPVIEAIEPIVVTAGETVTLSPEVYDPDGDEVTVTYSGWMSTDEYATTEDDVGEHVVTITASDGIAETSIDVTIIVEEPNRPPEIIAITG